MAARRLAAASTTAANSCDSSAINPTSGNGGAGGGADAALLLALGLCERVEVEVVRCLAFDSPGLLPADLQLVARHRLVPAEMRVSAGNPGAVGAACGLDTVPRCPSTG